MDWILLNFKKESIRFLIILSISLSCSWFNKEKKMPGNEKTKKISSAVIADLPGPTKLSVQFIDKTQHYGLQAEKAVRLYAVDFDGDGYTDLVTIPTYFDFPRFLKFDSKSSKFKLINYSPFEVRTRASYLLFSDFNKDGLLDVLVGIFHQGTRVQEYPFRLFVAEKKKSKILYHEQKQLGLRNKFSTPALSLIDINLDGLLDVYQGNWLSYENKNPYPSPDNLLIGHIGKQNNKKQFLFKDESFRLKKERERDRDSIYINARPTISSSTCDLDQNGYPDILTTSTHGYDNKLWLNQTEGREGKHFFIDVATVSEYAADSIGRGLLQGGGNSYISSCSDFNNDGIMDIYVGESFSADDSEAVDRSALLIGQNNERPQYIREDLYHFNQEKGFESDRRATWVDLNFDGLLDLVVENSGHPPYTRLSVFIQNSNHHFKESSSELGLDVLNPSGPIILDVNRDGRPDIISGQSTLRGTDISQRLYLFENNIDYKGNKILRVRLRGKKSNTLGVGAMIIVNTSSNTYRQWVESSQGGLPSQNEEGLFFGIAEKEKTLSIKVRWPIKKNKKILTRTYDLSKLAFKQSLYLTLCENGHYKHGFRKTCQ